jgi:hypothetical protein
MNHRLAQVSLARDGQLVGRFDLDPESRGPQPIEIDQPGGTFELRATKTVPGTNAKWREIVISELVVLGTAPEEELLAPAMPQVTIGSLDRPAHETGPLARVREEAPFPSLAAFCARHLEAEAKVLAHRAGSAEARPYCRRGEQRPASQRLAAPFEEIAVVLLLEGEQMVERLAIRTERGWFPTEITFAKEIPGPGCGMSSGYELDAAAETRSNGRGILTLKVTKQAAYLMATPASFEAAAEFLVACTPDARGAPVCREELTASFERADASTSMVPEWTAHPPRWSWRRDAAIDDEGHIRLAPCVGEKGPLSRCSRRNADLLRRF